MIDRDKVDYFFLDLDGRLGDGLPPSEALAQTVASYKYVFHPNEDVRAQTPNPPPDFARDEAEPSARIGYSLERVAAEGASGFEALVEAAGEYTKTFQHVLADDVRTQTSMLDDENSQMEKAADQFDDLISSLIVQKMAQNSEEMQRYHLAVLAQLEQAKAMYRTFILGDDC